MGMVMFILLGDITGGLVTWVMVEIKTCNRQ